jgi:CDP-glucose 4,6-dehydratase
MELSRLESDLENVLNSKYRGRRVLITGNTGFKGSWLSLFAIKLGAEIGGYSKDIPTEPSNFKICGLDQRMTHFVGDIRDLNRLMHVFSQYQPEIVFHLAAQPIVRESYTSPKITFDTNVGGTVNLLECVRKTNSVKAVVVITSDKCYRNFEWQWGYRENDTLGGKDPYSASKACAELVSRSYFESFFSGRAYPNIATVRAGNVIGGGDWAYGRIIPDCVKAFVQGEPVLLRNPKSVRPWQHVLEPLSGYLWLGSFLLEADSAVSGEAFNFGHLYDYNRTVQEVVKKFAENWGGARWKTDEERTNGGRESGILNLNCEKAMHSLKWHSVLSLEETIKMTADWYKAHYVESQNMYQFSRRQIDDYIKKAVQQGLEWAGAI